MLYMYIRYSGKIKFQQGIKLSKLSICDYEMRNTFGTLTVLKNIYWKKLSPNLTKINTNIFLSVNKSYHHHNILLNFRENNYSSKRFNFLRIFFIVMRELGTTSTSSTLEA